MRKFAHRHYNKEDKKTKDDKMMNDRCHILVFLVASTFSLTVDAQSLDTTHDNGAIGGMGQHFDESAPQRIMPTRFGGRSRKWREEAMEREAQGFDTQHDDSLHLPTLNQYGQPVDTWHMPMAFGGWNSWALHSGLNVQLGASVFAEFGKGAHSGAGFQENIALMYAMPVTDKLSVAVGGYLNNVNYAGGNWHDAGLSAIVGYRFNEHWEAYIYGQKSISNNLSPRLRYSMYDGYSGGYNPYLGGFGRLGSMYGGRFAGCPYSMYDLNGMGDRIGATVRYNINPSMSIEVSVEKQWLPNR